MHAQGRYGTTQPARTTPLRVQLTAKERPVYPSLFSRADPSNTGRVEGKAAVAFFSRSGLPMEILKDVWSLAAGSEGFLDRERFYVALRLIALAQRGHTVTYESLQAIPEVDLPQFNPVPAPATSQETDSFAISPAEKQRYEQIFQAQTQGKSTLGEQEARALFDRAGVSPSELAKVWSLADPQDTGVLGKNQFFAAMQLLVKAKNGVRLPDTLPPSLASLVPALVKSSIPAQGIMTSPARPSNSPAQPIKPSPEAFKRPDDSPVHAPKSEPSFDPSLLQELLSLVRGFDSRLDSLTSEIRSTKSEIATLRDSHMSQIESSSRDMKRYFDQTQAMLQSLPRVESQHSPQKYEENSSVVTQIVSEEIGKVRKDVMDLTGKWSEMMGNVKEIQGNLMGFQGEMKAVRSDLTGLMRDLGDFKGDVQELRGDLDDTRHTCSAIHSNLQGLTSGNEALTVSIESIEGSIKGLKGDFPAIPPASQSPDSDTQWSKICDSLENVRQENRETAELVRELGENMQQIREDLAGLKDAIESRPAPSHHDSQEGSKSLSPSQSQQAKETHIELPKASKSPFDLPQLQGQSKGSDFLDDFGLGLGNPNPKEGFDFALPQAQTDPNPKEEYDFPGQANPAAHDFMFEEMLQGARKSPSQEQDAFRFEAPQKQGFAFDSPQEGAQKSGFEFNFEGAEHKDDFQFDEQSPENKDIF